MTKERARKILQDDRKKFSDEEILKILEILEEYASMIVESFIPMTEDNSEIKKIKKAIKDKTINEKA